MTGNDRLALFTRELHALLVTERPDAMLMFNPPHDEDTFVQFSRRADESLFCEVSNKSEGWNSHSMAREQTALLTALGYTIPSPHHQSNPNKNYSGSAEALALEIEKIFRTVFGLGEEYSVESSGVISEYDI